MGTADIYSHLLDFTALAYFCPKCKRKGFIREVLVSLTRICLVGTCIDCGHGKSKGFDLLELDGAPQTGLDPLTTDYPSN